MIRGQTVLALVPARGGSKGLPGKNLMVLAGRPLLSWTAHAAQGSRYLDRAVLSTDDEAIAAAGRASGLDVPFMRPAELATDRADPIDVALHALDALPGFDLLVLLQPTSPLRSAADIDSAIERLVECGAPSCVTVAPVEQSPYWMVRVGDDHAVTPLLPPLADATRRQDLPPVYVFNGAVYAARSEWLRRERRFVGDGSVAVVMPAERSIDIDTAEDFRRLQAFVGIEGGALEQTSAAESTDASSR